MAEGKRVCVQYYNNIFISIESEKMDNFHFRVSWWKFQLEIISPAHTFNYIGWKKEKYRNWWATRTENPPAVTYLSI
jgi:hypothetical protein